ncbi:MAG: hypothetical protein M5U34_47025 [Chloroflexi bacterium]|nr:hypothetical protein [Chloroflexota bacterium]
MELKKTAVIQTNDLSKNYSGVAVLNGLDLNVPQHSIFGFLGAKRRRQNHHHEAAARVDKTEQWPGNRFRQ